jgi:hypothetical protein
LTSHKEYKKELECKLSKSQIIIFNVRLFHEYLNDIYGSLNFTPDLIFKNHKLNYSNMFKHIPLDKNIKYIISCCKNSHFLKFKENSNNILVELEEEIIKLEKLKLFMDDEKMILELKELKKHFRLINQILYLIDLIKNYQIDENYLLDNAFQDTF